MSAGIVSVDLSGYVIVTFPLSSTVTFVPSGNLSLFASSTAFLTASFSSFVKLSGFVTGVTFGLFGVILLACESPTVTGTSTILDEPSLKVTFTFPV